MIQSWNTISRGEKVHYRIFDIGWIQRQHPAKDSTANFVVLNSPAWVNIIPITPDNHIVFVRQYRHGTDTITLEVPGGLVEAGEDPRIAAQRECTEETGFFSVLDSELIGINHPNPAFLDNICYSFVWKGCTLESPQNTDEHEDIEVVLISADRVPELIQNGTITHSLVLTAFLHLWLKEKQQI
jgi:8-oxo-dGTP pyrophosphatase MutT (NUDIX family)